MAPYANGGTQSRIGFSFALAIASPTKSTAAAPSDCVERRFSCWVESVSVGTEGGCQQSVGGVGNDYSRRGGEKRSEERGARREERRR